MPLYMRQVRRFFISQHSEPIGPEITPPDAAKQFAAAKPNEAAINLVTMTKDPRTGDLICGWQVQRLESVTPEKE